MPRWSRLFRSPHRLRLVLLLYVVVPVAVAVGLGWSVALARLEALTEKRMQEEIELVARALGAPVSHALNQGSTIRLQQSLQAAEGIDRVYGAYVYDAGGDLVAALGRWPSRPEQQLSDVAHAERIGEYGEIGGRRIYSYFVPLTDAGGRINGVLQVTRRRRDFEEHISQLRIQAAAALTGFTLLLAGLVLWRHHRTLGRHVERLANDMTRIGEGDRRHRAKPDGFREIGALAVSLNDMLDRIDEHRDSQAALEARLHRSEKLAAIGTLSAGVAHELGTPLSVVHGRAQRLLRDPTLGERTLRAVREIREQVRRIDATVRQLLDFGGGRSMQPQPTRVGRILQRAAESVAGTAARTGVTVSREAIDDEAEVVADPACLELAVTNLLRNAVQATPGGSVRVAAAIDDEQLRIRVEDDGSGVPEELRSQVCDPFFTTKPVGQGTGLGLALSQRVVSDMSGRLEIGASALGGACFEITVPRRPPAAARGR